MMWKSTVYLVPIVVVAACCVVNLAKGQPAPISTTLASPVQLAENTAVGYLEGDWEGLFISAPTITSLLGQLVVLSGKVDFGLDRKPPVGGYKYVNHPSSFRATLSQVGHEAWSAFHAAHGNTHAIQLNMKEIPRKMKSVLETIRTVDRALMPIVLPVPLESIQEMGRRCAELSNATHQKFTGVIKLLDEILEGTQAGRGITEAEAREAKIALEENKLRLKNSEQQDKKYKIEMEKAEEAVKKHDSLYNSALAELPSGWESMAQRLGCAVIDIGKTLAQGAANALPQIANTAAMTKTVGGLASAAGPAVGALAGKFGGSRRDRSVRSAQDTTDDVDTLFAAKRKTVAKEMLNIAVSMRAAVKQIIGGAVGNNSASQFKAFDVMLEKFATMLDDSDGTTEKAQLSSNLNTGRTLAQEVGTAVSAPEGELSSEEKTSFQKTSEKFVRNLEPIIKEHTEFETTLRPLPTEGHRQIDDACGSSVNARFKISKRLETYEKALGRADAISNKRDKILDDITEFTTRIARLNLDTVNFGEIIKLMKDGIKILSDIKEKWNQLTHFFSAMAVRINHMVKVNLGDFIKLAERTMSSTLPFTPAMREQLVGRMAGESSEVLKDAHLIYSLSNLYLDVSTRYVMSQLAGVDRLSALPPDEQGSAINKLLQDNTAATNGIKEVARAMKSKYTAELRARQATLTQELKQLDQAASPADDINSIAGPPQADKNLFAV